MPRIDLASVPVERATTYPAHLRHTVAGRSVQALGDAAGLTQFGVNLFHIEPGSTSSLRHWHERQDEFLIMIAGELVLFEEAHRTVMRPGDCAGFKAGVPNAHHLVNESAALASFLVVGTRTDTEHCHYPDEGLVSIEDASGDCFKTATGQPVT